MSLKAVSIGVVGGGLMGCGIAAKFAAADFDVVVYDSDPSAKERIMKICRVIFSELSEGGAASEQDSRRAAGRVRVASGLHELRAVDLVIEAVPESLDLKQAVYARLEKELPKSAIIASSTSSFVPDALSEGMMWPERFLVAHFWNPPHLIPLVEVVAATRTTSQITSRVLTHLRQCGCEPVLLKRAVPGFIGNRFQFAVLREALHLLSEGVADAETIDSVMKHSLGRRYRRIGPLEGADLGGLETFASIGAQLMPHLAKTENVLEVLRAQVALGHKGRLTGQGLYTWSEGREAWLKQTRLDMLTDALIEDKRRQPEQIVDNSSSWPGTLH
jgi:3-hydroxybutyryl-CoA dehydrogenase